jgi:hypothetical protein
MDSALVVAIFTFLKQSGIGYERFWFDWRGGRLSTERAARSAAAEAYAGEAFTPLRDILLTYEPAASANLGHAYFTRETPRTMLIEEMEALWAPIAERDDWSAFGAALDEIDEMREAYAGDAKSSARPGIRS